LLETFASNPVDAIVPSFLTLGAIYLVSMKIGAFVVRLPADGWQPEGWTPPAEEETGDLQTTADVSAGSAPSARRNSGCCGLFSSATRRQGSEFWSRLRR
jgi:hypothetical protein